MGVAGNLIGSVMIALKIDDLFLPSYLFFILGAVAFLFHFKISNNKYLFKIQLVYILIGLWGVYNYSGHNYLAVLFALLFSVGSYLVFKFKTPKERMLSEREINEGDFTDKVGWILFCEKASVALSLVGYIVLSTANVEVMGYAFWIWAMASPFSYQVGLWIKSRPLLINTVIFMISEAVGIHVYFGSAALATSTTLVTLLMLWSYSITERKQALSV